jgi:hypothetical protein
MRRKDKDLRGALQAAKEVLDRAKPEGEGDGLEARTELIVEYVGVYYSNAGVQAENSKGTKGDVTMRMTSILCLEIAGK